MTIKVEGMAGMSIEEAFRESIRIAKKLNCSIDFDFNGVKCSAIPNGSIDVGVKNYHREIKSTNSFKYATSY